MKGPAKPKPARFMPPEVRPVRSDERRVRVGDIVALNSKQGGDSAGIVVGVFGPIVVWRKHDGTFDVFDEDGLYLVMPCEHLAPQKGPDPLLADAVRDEESVDCKGRSIQLGDRIAANSSHSGGIVVAVARGVLLYFCDVDDTDSRAGDFYFENASDSTVMPQVDDAVAYVRRTMWEIAEVKRLTDK